MMSEFEGMMTQEQIDQYTAKIEQEKYESIWINAVVAQLGNGGDAAYAMVMSDDVLEGFKLRFDKTVGGVH